MNKKAEEIIKTITNNKKELSPFEVAAQQLDIQSQVFDTTLKKMANRKKRAPSRVLKAIIMKDMIHPDQILHGNDEKSLFDLCERMMYHKKVFLEKLEEIKLKKEQENV